jgi:hypothetical protein
MTMNRFAVVAIAAAISLFLCDISMAAPRSFFAVLLGGNEVNSDGAAGAGDTNGSGNAAILLDANRGLLCFSINVSAIGTPVAAHIHRQVAGVNGDIVIGLTAPNAGNPGSSSGCITGVNRTVLRSIINTPSNFYVNVHTEDFQGGAVRGQLF